LCREFDPTSIWAAKGDDNKVNADAWNREGRGPLDVCGEKGEWGGEKSD